MKKSSKSTFGDIRDATVDIRKNIGFQRREEWADAPATFDSHSLSIHGHPVMEDWEDSYMRFLADIATSNGGIVLEVGFGMGISARYIQEYPVEKHVIVEANKDVFEHLVSFAESAALPVLPLQGFWEDITQTFSAESFSGILFDTYPLSEEEIHANHFPFFKEAFRLLKPGGVLTYYSDEISDFSPLHIELLQAAGFKEISKRVCLVEPPSDCQYWKSKTIVAPIVRK